jgi:hypothetical protein
MDGTTIADGAFLQASPRRLENPYDWDNTFANFNGDNKTDCFWKNSVTGEKAIWVMDGTTIVDGGFLQSSPVPIDDPADWNYKFADFNGDGKTDILWRNDITGLSTFWVMDGPDIINGGFLQAAPRVVEAGQWDYQFRELNGDGKTDFFWTSNAPAGEKAVWVMDGPNIVGGGFYQQNNPG